MRTIGRVLIVASILLCGADMVSAQDAPVRLEGRVMWRAGQTVVIAPDGSPSIHVDLSQVPQEQYGTLREGDRVVVLGSVPNERNRVIAASVERLTP